MSTALYTPDGDVLVPSEHTRGPWDAGQQHGGPVSALLATEIQRLAPEMQVARLTFEFLGPIPLAPVTTDAQIVKPGRRFQLAEATLSVDGRPSLLARAVLLRRGAVEGLPVAAEPEPLPAPEDCRSNEGFGFDVAFHRTGMEIRFVEGSFLEDGPATAWFRLAHELVAGEPTLPVARAVAAADFSNGIGRVVSFETHWFINTDLTVHLARDPVGQWVASEAVSRLLPQGTGLASTTLRDAQGHLGHGHQTLFVDVR